MLKQQDMTETARVVFNELSVTEPATAGEIAQNTYLSRERCQLILTQPLQVIIVALPLVIPALRLHFKVRRVRDYQVNRIFG
ncbi:hypothetical protein [Escherichia coli]|uniref:hypothetical protein n=1 Tax=Escherichia coli TaxID=562 RepID=UPI000ADC12D0|nr:hypothetical protein [Escherichia coli]